MSKELKTVTEVLDTKGLIPTNFCPKRPNRFILEIEGIEPYLVKSVMLPSFSWSETDHNKQFIVKIHDTLFNDNINSLREWTVKKVYRDATLKLLTGLGEVAQIWSLKLQPLKMELSNLDYSDSFLSEIMLYTECVVLSIENFKLDSVEFEKRKQEFIETSHTDHLGR